MISLILLSYVFLLLCLCIPIVMYVLFCIQSNLGSTNLIRSWRSFVNLNFRNPKCSWTEMFVNRNVREPKCSWTEMFVNRNVRKPKCSWTEMFVNRNYFPPIEINVKWINPFLDPQMIAYLNFYNSTLCTVLNTKSMETIKSVTKKKINTTLSRF